MHFAVSGTDCKRHSYGWEDCGAKEKRKVAGGFQWITLSKGSYRRPCLITITTCGLTKQVHTDFHSLLSAGFLFSFPDIQILAVKEDLKKKKLTFSFLKFQNSKRLQNRFLSMLKYSWGFALKNIPQCLHFSLFPFSLHLAIIRSGRVKFLDYRLCSLGIMFVCMSKPAKVAITEVITGR